MSETYAVTVHFDDGQELTINDVVDYGRFGEPGEPDHWFDGEHDRVVVSHDRVLYYVAHKNEEHEDTDVIAQRLADGSTAR